MSIEETSSINLFPPNTRGSPTDDGGCRECSPSVFAAIPLGLSCIAIICIIVGDNESMLVFSAVAIGFYLMATERFNLWNYKGSNLFRLQIGARAIAVSLMLATAACRTTEDDTLAVVLAIVANVAVMVLLWAYPYNFVMECCRKCTRN